MIKNLGIEIRILSNLIYNRLNQTTIEAENLTIHQYWILQYLTDNIEKEIYQKDIEQLFSIKRSTANQMLRTMEARGYICRTISSEDSRRNILNITENGIAARKHLDEYLYQFLLKFYGNISKNELEQFQKTLRKLWNNIE